MVLVLGKLPGQDVDEPVPTTTYPGGIGETEQMTVVPEAAGVRMVQVLGKLPGQDVDEPSAMMTNPLGTAETLHITVVPVVDGVVIVQVLGKLPGQDVDEPSAMMTNPLGTAETLHITVVPVVDGVVIVQVLGKLPGQDVDEPSAMMTCPAGMGELLQMVVVAALAGVATVTAEMIPRVMAATATAPRRRSAFATRPPVCERRGSRRTRSGRVMLVPSIDPMAAEGAVAITRCDHGLSAPGFAIATVMDEQTKSARADARL
ncbi:hypothetical protein [Micromonospora olivasterospora]|uniref:Uncharacterized protein n=1 Tax=Micromonospora olivasterospora TaxID=1880 RepID=A0A562I9B3_MICOL|nr:hypothetical protein [Micromonospora olivasterospora]TWH67609.1 hypothetical protein JD77_02589 [Micromonospora olivasterospora]